MTNIFRVRLSIPQAYFFRQMGLYRRLGLKPLSQSISISLEDCGEILKVLEMFGKGHRTAAALRRKIDSFQTGR